MSIDLQTLGLLKRAMKKDGFLELPADGNSMFPFIRKGEVCRFIPFTTIKRGDVILFYARDGSLIVHRIVQIQELNHQLVIFPKGDTNLSCDQPIGEERILGKLASIQKKHSQISSSHILLKAWGKLILTFPVLSGILQRYLQDKLK